MARLITPDGTTTTFKYRGIDDARRELDGDFDMVGGLIETGYMVMVRDTGALIPLPRNTMAELLTGYPELYGPAAVVSFEEAKEDEIMYRIQKPARDEFERRLAALTSTVRKH